ncbi:MAG: hypothetical protein ABR568_17695 [Pyrinomonadaceae bacterium]
MPTTNDPHQVAAMCFRENRDLFSDTAAAPEKFNLYNGLFSLANTVEEMRREILALRQEVYVLRQRQS